MPIYAYRCESCGHAKDVLQKISDAPLSVCPACGAESFRKQLTAAGFQLKGSGWYVTDFRNNNSGGTPAKKDENAKDGAKDGAKDTAGDAGKSGDGARAKSDAAAPAPSAAPSPAPAPAATASKNTPASSSGSS